MVTMGTCTADLFLRDLAESLARQLAEPATTADDFLRLASTGEPVRRSAVMLDDVPPNSRLASLLASYETALAAFRGPSPATLVDDALAAKVATYRASDDQEGGAGTQLSSSCASREPRFSKSPLAGY